MKPIVVVTLALLLWLAIASLLIIYGSKTPEIFGQIGDSFGILNSLFSALAFSGVLYSIWQQNETIKKQEIEIEQNRINSVQQNSILNLQLIESTFFTNLNGIGSIVESLNVNVYNNIQYKTYFEKIYAELHNAYFSEAEKPNLAKLRSFYYDNEWQFGHYFRFIKILLKLINDSEASKERKNLYIGILQSRMSNDELRTFLYYVISELSDHDDQPGTITYKERIELQFLMKSYDFFAVVRTRLAINLINPQYDWEILRRLVYEPFDKFSIQDL